MSDGSVSQDEETQKRYEAAQKQLLESSEKYYQENQKRLRKILRFENIMLLYAYIFTVYYLALLKITPLFSGTGHYREFFLGGFGIILLVVLAASSLVIGYLFYQLKGLVLAIINGVFAPLAAFGLTMFKYIELEQWIQRRRFQRLSPEEQERILDHELSLDYKYSSRGP